jgi:heavy metal translocating P-type ATPase
MKEGKSFYEKFGMFVFPVFILAALIFGLVFEFALNNFPTAYALFIMGIIPGGVQLIVESYTTLKNRSFALDYIAILAIIVSVVAGEYLVGSVIALMISSGNGLEKYAQRRAKSSLTALSKRIPDEALVYESEAKARKEKIKDVKRGALILVRKGEVIPLDGELETEYAQIDESSLTGEPYFADKIKGDILRSGTVNIGNRIIVKVTKEDKDSTYRQIINMVKKAEEEKSPLIRIAHKYNGFFAALSLIIAFGAFLYWHDLDHALAVLVIATPCPLLIAAPVALIGGMSASAKRKIIVKNLSAIEAVSRADTLVFDKTGTITIGKPRLKEIAVKDKKYDRRKILEIAEAIERNSLHPFARSIVSEARREKIISLSAKDIEEKIGKGISGTVGKKRYTLLKGKDSETNHLHLLERGKVIAEIMFEDILKEDAKSIILKLEKAGIGIHIFTGDKKETAEKLKLSLDHEIDVRSEMSPEDKEKGIRELKARSRVVAMVGDGINDAPALALSDAGMVFSHEEHTASSEAADIVFLGGGFSEVYDSINISKRTMQIAKESMMTGMGLSIAGMLFAAGGFIVPIAGAILQEVIDVSVIINSLRAIKYKR